MGQFVVPYLLNPIPMDTRLALQRLRFITVVEIL